MAHGNRVSVPVGAISLSLGLTVVLSASIGDKRGPAVVTTAELVVRERASGVTSIGMSVIEQLPGTRRFDQLIATLPTDRSLTPALLPDGWTTEQKGKQLRASGPPVNEFHARFDLNGRLIDDYSGKDATIQRGLGGRLDDPMKIKIVLLPKVEATPNLDGILTLPLQATPGLPILIGVTDPYRQGTWQLTTPDNGSVPLIPMEALRDMQVIKSGTPQALYRLRGTDGLTNLLARPAPRPFITAYPEMGRFTGARFIDRWGETLVNAPITIMPVAPATGSRVLSGGSAFAFAGQAACVSGRFPTFNDPYGLLLDGKIPLEPWGASQTTVMLGIPDGTTPGPHTITEPGGSSSITVGVLTVEGSLDQDKLWKGDSTAMRLRIVGTDQKIPLGVLNRTPGIIEIEGGVQQTVTSPGGKDNAVSRNVKGVHRGNFSILYSVNSPGCGAAAGGR